MKNIPSIKNIKDSTVKQMKSNKLHDPAFNRLVQIYAETVYQYNYLMREWEEQGYLTTVMSGQNSVKRNPIMDQINTLRRDIMALSDRLMLNPKSMALEVAREDPAKVSALAAFLSGSGV